MTWNKKLSHESYLYKKLGHLKLHDVHELELAKFMQYMHKLFNYKLPELCILITSQQLTKFMIMLLENQADLITFPSSLEICRTEKNRI